VIENFFGSGNQNAFILVIINNTRDLRTAINKYICYYNHESIKQKLKGLSPVEYRTQAQIAA